MSSRRGGCSLATSESSQASLDFASRGLTFTSDPLALAFIVLRTLCVYVALLFGLRLAGKRELGQMTPFDLVVLLIIANAVQNAMVGTDTSLGGGLLAAFVLLVVNWIVARMGARSARVRVGLLGTPTLLINDGHLIREHLAKEGIAEDEVMQALREHGIDDLSQVKLAVLEVDGTISVVPTGAPVTRTQRHVRTHRKQT